MSDPVCPNPTQQSPLNRSSKDKFIMVLELPHVLRKRRDTDPSLNIKTLHLSIYGTVVPDVAVPAIDARFQGQNLHLSTHARPSYPPLSVNFVIDNEYKNYILLWKWLDVLNHSVENGYTGSSQINQLEVGDQFEYQTNISILALSEYNKPVIQFNYSKGFITKLGGIQYSYRDGALIEGSAEFHYSQLSISDTPNIFT